MIVALLILTTIAFADTKSQAQARLTRATTSQQRYTDLVASMSTAITDTSNQAKYDDYNRQLVSIERQIFVLDDAFKKATTVESKERIKQQIEQLSQQYSQLVAEFKRFVDSL
jgi:hypothetical protein